MEHREGGDMNFTIDQTPPEEAVLSEEREHIAAQIRRIQQRDTIITFLLILTTSIAASLAVYWSTDNIKYAAIAFSVFPVIGVIMSLAGLITTVGFRSNAMRMIELRNEMIALNPVSEDSCGDVNKLSDRYAQVDIYRRKVAFNLLLFLWGANKVLLDRAQTNCSMSGSDLRKLVIADCK